MQQRRLYAPINQDSVNTSNRVKVCNVSGMERVQLNLRISEELAKLIDEKRIAKSRINGVIPTRSEIVRLALEKYLEIDIRQTEFDRRTSAARSKSQS